LLSLTGHPSCRAIVSLVLFVLGLRHLGTARTGAYFSLAPFIGAVLAILLLHDPVSVRLFIAGGLMGLGSIPFTL
jgi:drug/metabolite transporter (DMT)-like permease